MRGILVLCVALAGCTEAEAQPEPRADPDCYKTEQLRGCCDAGASCTWFAPAGASCTDAFTSFCGSGLAWCSSSVCRTFCAVTEYPRCSTGLVEHHERDAGADICVCI